MAVEVLSVSEDLAGRTSQLGEDGVRTGQRVYSVALDLSAATAAEVAAAEAYVEDALPVARWQRHPAYPAMTARTVKLDPAGSPEAWAATVGYSSAALAARSGTDPTATAGGAAGAGGGQTPSAGSDQGTKAGLRPPDVSMKFRSTTRVVTENKDTGGRVLNAAGDPFDPPPVADKDELLLAVKLCRPAAWLTLNWLGFHNTINDFTFRLLGIDWPTHTLRCRITDVQSVWDQEQVPGVTPAVVSQTLCWQVSLELLYDPNSWAYQLLDCGRRARPAAGAEPQVVVDRSGSPLPDPVLLNADGTRAAAGAAPRYVTGRRYEQRSFTTLLS